jgi:hypothetical protein
MRLCIKKKIDQERSVRGELVLDGLFVEDLPGSIHETHAPSQMHRLPGVEQ